MSEIKKKELFEKIWNIYWWKKRTFSYRVNNSEEEERKLLAEFLDILKQLEAEDDESHLHE